MARLLILLASVLISTAALKCYMAQSTDPNYIPNEVELGLCPVSSTACFRTLLNTTYQGFQVTGARFGCDSAADSVCQNGADNNCQSALMGTCCCYSDGCNLGNATQPPIVIVNGTTTTPSAPSNTTTPHELICYSGYYQPNRTIAPEYCALGTKHCFNMTVDGLLTVGCDTNNGVCQNDGNFCTASDDGTVICCCSSDYCNGGSIPKTNITTTPVPSNTTALHCYTGYDQNTRVATTCPMETSHCFSLTYNGTSAVGCDIDNRICQNDGSTCTASDDGTVICCCSKDYCNGGENPPPSNTPATANDTTVPSTGRLVCYNGLVNSTSYTPYKIGELETCSRGTMECMTMVENGQTYYSCDDNNQFCQLIPPNTCQTTNGVKLCCCQGNYCNGSPIPGSLTTPSPTPAAMSCYTGVNSDINYYPNYSEIQSCTGGVQMCYRTFLSNNLYYGCDNQKHCMGRVSGSCFDTGVYGRMCCCGEKLCNGQPFGEYNDGTSSSALTSTLLSTLLTIIVHNFV